MKENVLSGSERVSLVSQNIDNLKLSIYPSDKLVNCQLSFPSSNCKTLQRKF